MTARRALLGAAMTSPAALVAAAPAWAATDAAATASPPAPAVSTALPEIRWRMASSFPRNIDVVYTTGERIAARVAALTQNRFQIRCFASGEVVPGLQVLDAVQNGTIECGHTASYYYTGKDPSFAFFTALPFGLNSRQLLAWMTQGPGQGFAEELFGSYGVVGFPAGDTGAQMGGWFTKEVASLADLQGLKFRIAGLGGDIFARLGAVPTQVVPSDIYPALERGSLDAVEFVGPYDDEKLGFVRVAKYYYAPGFWEPGAHLHLMVGKQALASLPPLYRTALEIACNEANAEMLARYDNLNPPAMRRLVAAGAQLRLWPRPVMVAAWQAAHQLYAETSAKNPRFKAIWENYRAYRDLEFQWFRLAEDSYSNFAFPQAERDSR